MEEIKILRLVTGEDIICRFIKVSTDSYAIMNPMVVGIKYKKDGANLTMAHWLPIEIIKKNETLINPRDVIAIVDPADDVAEYFDMTVDKLNDLMKAKFTPTDFKDLDDLDDLDDLEEISEAIKQSHKHIIH